jgi:hypothetical protein
MRLLNYLVPTATALTGMVLAAMYLWRKAKQESQVSSS